MPLYQLTVSYIMVHRYQRWWISQGVILLPSKVKRLSVTPPEDVGLPTLVGI